jgi:hypothetical protein
MFGRPLLLAGGLWLLLLAARLVSGRGRPRDLVGLSFAFSVLVYIHVIRAGALIHVYRYLYGGVACAIAACDLAAELSRRGRPALAMAFSLGLLAVALPPAWRALVESRMNGGIPLWTGAYDPETAKIAFAERIHEASRPGDVLYVHPSFVYRQEAAYYFDRDLVNGVSFDRVATLTPAERRRGLLLCEPALLGAEDRESLRRLARGHPIWQVSRYLMVDLRKDYSDVHAQEVASPPARSPLRRYLEGPHPRLRRVPDPAAESRWAALLSRTGR